MKNHEAEDGVTLSRGHRRRGQPTARCGGDLAQPTRHIVVAGPPGNGLDALARLLCAEMARSMKANFVVDNKPGASGHIAGALVARARPDGYTLIFGSSTTHAVSPHILTDIRYKPIDDFDPISLVAKVHNVLVCTPELPVTTVAELIAYAKANPGKLSFGSTGTGSNLHLGMELFKMMSGTDMQHAALAARPRCSLT